ncbi:hypothetical protein EON64_03940 [archaeon]|nr:MAG: hypothetical protein EON64_03940 [archaeon]
MQLLQSKVPTSAVVDYPNMDHGFLLRSNVNDREVHNALVHSLSQIMDFFSHHFQMDPSQLVQGPGKSAKEFSDSLEGQSGLGGQFKDRGEVRHSL